MLCEFLVQKLYMMVVCQSLVHVHKKCFSVLNSKKKILYAYILIQTITQETNQNKLQIFSCHVN